MVLQDLQRPQVFELRASRALPKDFEACTPFCLGFGVYIHIYRYTYIYIYIARIYYLKAAANKVEQNSTANTDTPTTHTSFGTEFGEYPSFDEFWVSVCFRDSWQAGCHMLFASKPHALCQHPRRLLWLKHSTEIV